MGLLDLFKAKKKYTAEELRDVQEVLIHRENTRSSGNNLIKQMREMNELQRELARQKEEEVAEIADLIAQNAPDGDSTEQIKMFGDIVAKFLSKNNNNQAPVQFAPPVGGQVPPTTDAGVLTEEQAVQIAEEMKKDKKLAQFMATAKNITGADFEKIKRCL